jgi:hypothetical protein
MSTFDLKQFDVAKYDAILARGLCYGMGTPNSQVCIEAAICETLGLPHSDDPKCVAQSVRRFKIGLNDVNWSSPSARAKGLRELGIAQLGSLGVVNDVEFVTKLTEKTIRLLIPKLFRYVFPNNQACLDAAARCENEGTGDAASDAARYASGAASYAARYAARYAASYASGAARYASGAARYASDAARYASDAASYARDAASDARYAASCASDAARYAASYARDAASDEYLQFAATLALETLRELNSPGCTLL